MALESTLEQPIRESLLKCTKVDVFVLGLENNFKKSPYFYISIFSNIIILEFI